MDINIRPVWLEVNLDCIKNNIQEIRKRVKDKDIIAVVKANAYGHGAVELAPIMLENGADKLAVAVITEALELRQSGIKEPILILGYTPAQFTKELIDKDLEQTVSSLDYAMELSNVTSSLCKDINIHIKLDSGMGRLGFLLNEESLNHIVEISNLKNIKIKGIFTHFSTSDEKDKSYTILQINKFQQFIKKLEEKGVYIEYKHLANSAAILDIEESYYDAVRPGIILYGYYPSNEVNKEEIKLMPSLTLKSQIVHVKTISENEYISYGNKYKTNKETVIATLPIGYADGYTRALHDKAKVIINGQFAPIVGRICMDQCMVDITHIDSAKVGDEVILLGAENGLKFDADDIANLLNTINYEVICGISRRVPRVYKQNDKIVKIINYV